MELKLKRYYTGFLFSLTVVLAWGSLLLFFWGCDRIDSLVQEPGAVHENSVTASKLGLSDHRLVDDLIEQVVEAVQSEDLNKSIHFFSTEYSDSLGFNIALMRKLIKRTYRRFDEPRIHFKEPPDILIDGSRAIVQAKVRLSVIYSGKRNYILGDSKTHNSVRIRLSKHTNGWKIKGIEDLKPLGFEEGLLRHLGADLGLALTPTERKSNKRFCMPCRLRVKERFINGY